MFDRFRADREFHRKTLMFVERLMREPDAADVEWLSARATRGDHDHAQWELRYARRTLGLIAAQRDALDDRTGSAVARELTDIMLRDRTIDPAKRDIAQAQFNARLSAYRDGLETRSSVPIPVRMGQTLFAFAGGSFRDADENITRAGALLTEYLAEANHALREIYGTASLPEDVVPSALAPKR